MLLCLWLLLVAEWIPRCLLLLGLLVLVLTLLPIVVLLVRPRLLLLRLLHRLTEGTILCPGCEGIHTSTATTASAATATLWLAPRCIVLLLLLRLLWSGISHRPSKWIHTSFL
jgi:hypothetical protein